MHGVALMHDGYVPPAKVFRIISSTAAAAYINLQFEVIADDTGDAQGFIGIAQDVSQQMLLSQAGQNAAERVETIMRALNVDGFWRKDKQGDVFDYSLRGNLRRRGATVLGRAWLETIREDQREKVSAVTRQAMATGKAYAVSVNVICEDGIDRPYISQGFPVKDKQGHIVEWYGVVREQRVDHIRADLAETDVAEAANLATGATVRALCALFGWTYDEAANRSALSVTTINRFVSSTGILAGKFRRKSVEFVLRAFLTAGARFHITNDRRLFICRGD